MSHLHVTIPDQKTIPPNLYGVNPGRSERSLKRYISLAMLSVIIVNWNTKDLLRACINSILLNPPACKLELIVVDNASPDGSAKMVAEEFPEIKLVDQNTNTGYAQGNNSGFALATGNWLLALNPDTEVPDGALDKAVKILQERPAYGVLSVKLIGPDGEVQSSIRGFPSIRGLIGAMFGLNKSRVDSDWNSYRLTNFDYELEQPAPQPMGTFLLFRREALKSIQAEFAPFDPQFPIFFNDVDLLCRLSSAGWPCIYSPKIWVKHHGGMSTRQVRKPMIWESHRSLFKYLLKHHLVKGRLNQTFVRAGLIIGALIRARGYYERF